MIPAWLTSTRWLVLDTETTEPGRSVMVQRSLVGRVHGLRFTVVWSPSEPTQAPAVYADPDHPE